MRRAKLSDFNKGWFIGDFLPSMRRTPSFEAGFKVHRKGSAWNAHYQKHATEYNYIVRGTMKSGSRIFHAGEVVEILPGEIMAPKFLTDCEVMVIKVPSLPTDKVLV